MYNSEDKRINVKKNFLGVYISILIIMFITNAGSILIFNHELTRLMSLWVMILTISAYVFFMGLMVSLLVRKVIDTNINLPLRKVASVARLVANGNFQCNVEHIRKDGMKDHVEVLIDDFNLMIKELRTIEMMKTDFLANVSHEIKTPLAIIQNYAVLLKSTNLTESQKYEYITVIESSAYKLSTLISDILRLNKLENQEIISKKAYYLNEQVEQCILNLDEYFEQKNISTQIDLEEIKVENDKGLIEIAINNLLTNAIKYTDINGCVKVNLKRISQNTCVLKIADSGCGIPEDKLKKVFDRFYQVDYSHHTEGNGLGLSIVKRIIDLTDSELKIQSELGEGTTVHLYMMCL